MRTDDLYLADIIEAARSASSILAGYSLDDFIREDPARSAVMWKLLIIGEACGKLSAKAKEAMGDAPWNEIRGFRNIIVHGYFSLDWKAVWRIVVEDVPRLGSQAERALAAIRQSGQEI